MNCPFITITLSASTYPIVVHFERLRRQEEGAESDDISDCQCLPIRFLRLLGIVHSFTIAMDWLCLCVERKMKRPPQKIAADKADKNVCESAAWCVFVSSVIFSRSSNLATNLHFLHCRNPTFAELWSLYLSWRDRRQDVSHTWWQCRDNRAQARAAATVTRILMKMGERDRKEKGE